MFDEVKQEILEDKTLALARSGDIWVLKKIMKEAVRDDGILIIPEGIEVLPAGSLIGNLEITKLVLPSTVKIIEESAFADCRKLKSVKFNDGLERIGNAAFKSSGLSSVDIPETVKDIGSKAFSQSKELEEVTFHSGLRKIGEWAFSGTKISKADIPFTVAEIGECAFVDCDNLGKVKLNNPKADIHPRAFDRYVRIIKARKMPNEM